MNITVNNVILLELTLKIIDNTLIQYSQEMYMATLHRFSFLYAMGWKVFFVWHKDFKKGLMGRYYRGPQDDLY